MRIASALLPVLAPLLLLPGTVAAQQERPFSIGATAGTLGIGAEAGYRLSPSLGLRGGASWFRHDFSRTVSGIDYDAEVRLGSAGLVLDYYPFGGGFRLSGGARVNDNRVDLAAVPGAGTTVTIGGTTYAGEQVGRIDGRVEVNRITPYLGIGYEGRLSDGLSLSADVGALWHGRPSVSLDATGLIPAGDVERERRDIEDDLKAFQFHPVLTVALKYRF